VVDVGAVVDGMTGSAGCVDVVVVDDRIESDGYVGAS
jgi:hypothetical protein